MLDIAATVGLTNHSVVLDAACYNACTSVPLVQRFGCWLLGVDLGRAGPLAGRKAADEAGAGDRVFFAQGRLEALPATTAAYDLVWCRDAISCADCRATMSELARVTKPGGTVLLYTSCATARLETKERDALFTALGIDPGGMDAATIEREAARAGLEVQQRVTVGSQWLQHRLETDPTAFDLLSLARLTEWPERYIAAWGETWYQRILGWHQWPIYQALGKLEGRIWVFRARAAAA
jgi:SAM-dependent methyltransferase